MKAEEDVGRPSLGKTEADWEQVFRASLERKVSALQK